MWAPASGPLAQDALPEEARRQLDQRRCRAVRYVENRVDLDEVQAADLPALSQELHKQAGFPIGEAAGHRSSDPGRDGGVQDIGVERHVQAITVSEVIERLDGHRRDATLVEVGHRVRGDAEVRYRQ